MGGGTRGGGPLLLRLSAVLIHPFWGGGGQSMGAVQWNGIDLRELLKGRVHVKAGAGDEGPLGGRESLGAGKWRAVP